ncbi:MAG TPA: endo-1,4-beta-xylanase [Mycobacteriales bacterium]|nr:endo-1,4-beta-xylanase [Mycobacteriales bacterium]
MTLRRFLGALASLVTVAAGAVAVAPAARAADPVVVLTSDFENGTSQGWFGRGSAALAVSPDTPHAGAASLLTTGRTATWNGPGRDVLGLLAPGATYTVRAQVRLAAGAANTAMHLTMQHTPTGGTQTFERVANATGTATGWTEMLGEYSFQTDSSELQLYLESDDASVSYYLDDLTITQTAPPPNGPPDEAGAASDFEGGTAQGWFPRISSEQLTVSTADAHSGQRSLLTANRTAAFAGPAFNVLGKMTKGKKYALSVWVKLAPGQATVDMRLSVERRLAGTPAFQTIAAGAGVTSGQWAQLSGTFVLGVDVDFLTVYVETASGTASFFIDDFVLTFLPAKPIQADLPSLKDVLAGDFPVGAAASPADTVGEKAKLLAKHFDSITPGNAMKWDATEPTEGNFTFGDADTLAAFAAANNIKLRGHTLVWHSQTPAWVFQHPDGTPLAANPADKALLLSRLETHIRAVAGRYADQIYAWDVANEVIDESQPDGLRRSPWYTITGLDYLRVAFRVAREAAPNAKLFINDYNTEYPAKRVALFNVVQRLRAEGVPIDGVGHQLHINIERQRLDEIEKTFHLFARLGIEQQVTELDVSSNFDFVQSLPSFPPDVLAAQGYRYRDLFNLFRRYQRDLTAVTIWGGADDGTWLKSFPISRLDQPLLFDEDLQAKPAYWGIVDPSRLPQITRTLLTPQAHPRVDGQQDLQWTLLPSTQVFSAGAMRGDFQARWDGRFLYVDVTVTDPSRDPADAVDLFVDQDNGKTGTYGTDDAHYRIRRDGRHTAGIRVETRPTGTGYRVEAALPLRAAGAVDRPLGFDLRLTDVHSGQTVSWNDNRQGQDTDTSRWGTLTLASPAGTADVGRGTPVIDGVADRAWAHAARLGTAVRVLGTTGATATAKLLWDAGHLYVLATVHDPTLDNSSPNAFEQDSVEIFVDPDNTKNTGYTDDDGQYRVSFTNAQTISGNFNAGLVANNLTSATKLVPGGYVVEASIAFNTVTPHPGSLVGFDLQVNDATAGTRTAVTTWQDPTGLSFRNTSRWGTLHLVH